MRRKLKRKLREKVLIHYVPTGFYMRQEGYCPICQQDSIFVAADSWLREHLACKKCTCIPRERALMMTIEKYYPNWTELFIHESSPCDRGVSPRLQRECGKYLGSQYYANHEFGSMIEGYRNENLELQTFEDDVFDLVITQDVMEHVYDPEKAFKEIARTLKKGGAHIFTVPIDNKHSKTEVWAKKGEDGNPIFLKEEQYHGNPIDSKESPVTMHWGYDIVDFIKTVSGLDTEIIHIDDLHHGIRGGIEVFVSKK